MTDRLGEIAAIGTAVLWTLTYVQFTIAVRIVGADVLNRLRLLIALAALLALHTIAYGVPLPANGGAAQWIWLGLSGVIGFALSETFLFRALYHLGAHRTALAGSLIPVLGAVFAWIALGERMGRVEIVAGLITIAGIALVASARQAGSTGVTAGNARIGWAFALCAAMTQSGRYLLSVQGMRGGFPVLSANVIQIGSAAAAVWVVALLGGRAGATIRALRDRSAAIATTGGALTGPVFGVTLSLVALSHTRVGIASTLMALTPVFLLPISTIVFKEPLTVRRVVGTVLAVSGVAILFLV